MSSKQIHVIAEIANAHQGDPARAIKMASAAIEAGASSIKFQIYFAHELLVQAHPRFQHFSGQAFSPSEWQTLLMEAKGLGHPVFADVFGIDAFNLAVEAGLDGIKIHSSDLANIPLLEAAATFDGTIFVSAGGGTIKEIAAAIDILRAKHRHNEIVLMHGFQAYPTSVGQSSLVRLRALREIFGESVELGYMDHADAETEFATLLPLVCVPFDVAYIEKHITFDRHLKGVDYFSSMEPTEFKGFIEKLRDIEAAIGSDYLNFSEEELGYRETVKKSWVTKRQVKAGTKLVMDDLVMKRVHDAPPPAMLKDILGMVTLRDLESESLVTKAEVSQKVLALVVVRTESSRLKGKALLELAGDPTIVHLIERLRVAQSKDYISDIVVCTTSDPSDDDLVAAIEKLPVTIVRGSVEDVLSRMTAAMGMFPDHQVVLRVTGDDIMVDPDYINESVNYFLERNADYCSAKALPSGTEVEVFSAETLRSISNLAMDTSGTEYLTNYILENKDQFNVEDLPVCEAHRSDQRLTIDTKEDFEVVSALIENFAASGNRYTYTIGDILKFVSTNAAVANVNADVRQRQKPPAVNAGLDWAKLFLQPTVTVYITNYNYASFIEEAIQSVLRQTYSNFELIIIDDGSTDGSRHIISQYEHHPKVRVVFQQNLGLNRSNNVASSLARGKFLIRLDADDFLNEMAIQLMVEKLEANEDLALVFSDYFLVNRSGRVIGQEYRHDFSKDVSLKDQPAHGACSMIRLSVLKQVGGYSEEFNCQDGFEIWVKLLGSYEVANINLPLFYYRQHGENLTTNSERLLTTRAAIIRKHASDPVECDQRTLCIIPIRSDAHPNRIPMAIRPFADTTLLDLVVQQAKDTRQVHDIVLTTNDLKIFEYAKERHGNDIIVDLRSDHLSALNVPIDHVVAHVLSSTEYQGRNPDSIVVINYEYPLRNPIYIEKSIDVLRLFDTPASLSLVERTGNLYRHEGKGMVPLKRNTSLRLEREAVYEELGGIHAFTLNHFTTNGTITCENATHILLDDTSGRKIVSEMDFEVCEMLFKIVNRKQFSKEETL